MHDIISSISYVDEYQEVKPSMCWCHHYTCQKSKTLFRASYIIISICIPSKKWLLVKITCLQQVWHHRSTGHKLKSCSR